MSTFVILIKADTWDTDTTHHSKKKITMVRSIQQYVHIRSKTLKQWQT